MQAAAEVSFWTQAAIIARKDLRTEWRRGEVVAVTIPFGAIALMLIPFAVGVDVPLLRRIGPGIYWSVVLLFGMLVALRQSAADAEAQRDLLGMLGIDPAARYVGQAGANTILLLAFEALLLPVALALYDARITGWPWLFVLIPLVAGGLGQLGTLAGGVVIRARSGAALVPLLVAPLAIPLLLGATQALEGLRLSESILGWILLLVTMNLILAIAGVTTARPLQEVNR